MSSHEKVTLEPTTASSRRARLAVSQWLRGIGHPEVTEDASLVVAELVANAVKHGGARIELDLTAQHNLIRIAVFDSDNTAQDLAPLQPNPSRQHGRGLAMVEHLATRWGRDAATDGKIVWVEIDLHPAR